MHFGATRKKQGCLHDMTFTSPTVSDQRSLDRRQSRTSTGPADPRDIRLIGIFPGLGSRSAYRGHADSLLRGTSPEGRSLLETAVAALQEQASFTDLLLDGTMPSNRIRKQGRIGAGMVATNALLAQRFGELAAESDIEHHFAGFTGESFGMLSAAVASGALGIGDGIRIAEAFMPMMLLASSFDSHTADDDEFLAKLRSHLPPFRAGEYPVEEHAHVIGLIGDPEDLSELLHEMTTTISRADIEVHKKYSWRQVNVYVREAYMSRFTTWMEKFPLVAAQELKEPTTFRAHSNQMRPVRDALNSWIADQNIIFHDPHTPVLANHQPATLTSGHEIREAILAMTDQVMDSEGTVRQIEQLSPDLILELGPGLKTLELLRANGVTVPAAAWDHEDQDVVSALSISRALRASLARLRESEARIASSDLELAREILCIPTESLSSRCAVRIARNAMSDLSGDSRSGDKGALRRFLELFQHTLVHREDVNIHAGQLVTRSRVKKQIDGDTDLLGRATTELEVLQPDNTTSLLSLGAPTHAEAIVFHFEKPEDTRPAEIIRAARTLVDADPFLEPIRHTLRTVVADHRSAGFDIAKVQVAVAFVTHRLSMFELLKGHRPSLITQMDHALAGSDRYGWLISLVAAGAVSPMKIISLIALLLDPEPDIVRTDLEIDKLIPCIIDPIIPVLSPEGAPLRTRREMREATLRVFHDGALDRARMHMELNGVCLVISLGSALAPYRVKSESRHHAEVISVRTPIELLRKGVNRALDAADESATLAGSNEREHVVRYASQRRLLSSTVNAYIEQGETVVGFGSGGSESMTMFLKRDGESDVIVRKVLSDALTTAPWDPEGTGAMLPPFTKAKKQAEYLRALPENLRSRFPMVGKSSARSLPIPRHQTGHRSDSFQEYVYEMSYLPGVEVGRWIEDYRPPTAIVARVYEVIMTFLHHEVHSFGRSPASGNTLEEQYFSKIEKRLELCRTTAPSTFGSWLLDTEHILINGRRLRNIRALLERFRQDFSYRQMLEPRFHSLVMGDTNTENIKLANVRPLQAAQQAIELRLPAEEIKSRLREITAESIGLQFLDPRAIGYQSSGAGTRDDPMYDNKPWHNSIGHYDEIHNELFDLQVGVHGDTPSLEVEFFPDNVFAQSYRIRDITELGVLPTPNDGIEAYFAPVMRSIYRLDDPNSAQHQDDPYWLTRFVFTMGTHFTAMPPFHFSSEIDGSLNDSPSTQRRPLAIYAEGIKWLNWALEILEGDREEFLGIATHPYRTAD